MIRTVAVGVAGLLVAASGSRADCSLQVEINLGTGHVLLNCVEDGGAPCPGFWNIEVAGPEGSFLVDAFGSPGEDVLGTMVPIGHGTAGYGHALAEGELAVAYGWGEPGIKLDGSGWAEYGSGETNCYALACGESRDLGQIYVGSPDVSPDDFTFTTTPCGEFQVVAGDVVVTTGLVLGDVNGDGVVDGLDIQPFVDLLTGGGYQAEADINDDDVVDGLDIQPFVDIITGAGGTPVPEPVSAALILAGLPLVVRGLRKR